VTRDSDGASLVSIDAGMVASLSPAGRRHLLSLLMDIVKSDGAHGMLIFFVWRNYSNVFFMICSNTAVEQCVILYDIVCSLFLFDSLFLLVFIHLNSAIHSTDIFINLIVFLLFAVFSR
jgi:hypothetical protein